MAHDHHDHQHGDSAREYFTEQLLTIFVVGLFGAVAILMYDSGKLKYILVKEFHIPVLVGGIAILVLVAIRAITVWREAGMTQDHGHDHGHEHHHDHGHTHDHAHDHHAHDHHAHDHEHGPDCDHTHGPGCEHEHHDHEHAHAHDHHDHGHDHTAEDHGHSHDLAWVFARMLVLFFPVALFISGVPNSGFSQEHINKLLGQDELLSADAGAVQQGAGTQLSFNDLNDAGFNDAKREALKGQVGILKGQFRRLGDKQFTLYRLKMTCCATDQIPLKVQIVAPTAVSGFSDGQWVEVKGEVRFLKKGDSSQYVPYVAVADVADIRKIDQPLGE